MNTGTVKQGNTFKDLIVATSDRRMISVFVVFALLAVVRISGSERYVVHPDLIVLIGFTYAAFVLLSWMNDTKNDLVEMPARKVRAIVIPFSFVIYGAAYFIVSVWSIMAYTIVRHGIASTMPVGYQTDSLVAAAVLAVTTVAIEQFFNRKGSHQ